jgi:diguanylate cyclase (GGDEF)-like protein
MTIAARAKSGQCGMSKTPTPVDHVVSALGSRRLAAIVREVLSERSVESVLGRALATLRELVWCDDVVVWGTCAQDELAVAVVEGEDAEAFRSLRVKFGEGLTGKAAQECRPVVSNSAHLDPAAGTVPGTMPTPEAVACLPLTARDQLLGVLTLYRQGENHCFAEHEIALAEDFAAVAALALDNARTHRELERLARTDELTGLPNRRHFLAQLERELARSRRTWTPLSLLLLDIDNFKLINDSHGHAAGDRALMEVARSISCCVRAADVVARLGGDEFAVLLPESSRAVAEALARRISGQVAQQQLPFPTTVSIGVSAIERGESNDLLEQADRLLYCAKRARPDPKRVA